MSAPAFFDALGDARTRWLNGDPHAWAHYTECCLKLEAELQAAQRSCSPSAGCSCRRASCSPDDAPPRASEGSE